MLKKVYKNLVEKNIISIEIQKLTKDKNKKSVSQFIDYHNVNKTNALTNLKITKTIKIDKKVGNKKIGANNKKNNNEQNKINAKKTTTEQNKINEKKTITEQSKNNMKKSGSKK